MVQTQLKILRVFGLSAAEVSAVLRAARDDGCPGLRLLERDGEFAVCVQVSAPTQAMAEEYCNRWVARLQKQFGDNVYADGETSLAQAVLDLLLEKRRLIVAADETTGRLLGGRLQPLAHSEAVYDFGTESYADAEVARQIAAPGPLAKKFPGDVVQLAAGRAITALAAAGADFATVYMPATVGQCPFVLVADKRGVAACAIAPEQTDAAIGNQILDLLRRRLQGLHLTDSSIAFRPGQDRPLLIVSEAGRSRGNTTRFSLRRRTADENRADFEPMVDYDTVMPAMAAAPVAVDPQPTGTISFEDETEPAAPAPLPDPLEIRTAGADAAQRSRTLRTGKGHAAHGDAKINREAPTPSILDEEIPDFMADPIPPVPERPALRGTQPEPDAYDVAASRLFSLDEADAAPAAPARKKKGKKSEHGAGERGYDVTHNRSLAIIEKSERRRRRTIIGGMIFFLLAMLVGGIVLWWFFSRDLGAVPNPQNYGTAAFDYNAGAYLKNGLLKREGVVGYLGFPGKEGRFVYAAGTEPATDEKTGEETASIVRFATPNALDGGSGNTVLDCTGTDYADFTALETLQANSGFTLYMPEKTYAFKVVNVYYYDPAETGIGALPVYTSTDLSSYYDYLGFAAGMYAHSLFDTGVDIEDGSRFLTLTTATDEQGIRLCITGRLIEEGEIATLVPSAIKAVEDPLLTAAQYQAKGQPMPAVAEVMSASVDRFAQQSAARTAKKNNAEAGNDLDTDALSSDIAAMVDQTQSLMASADELMAGLTDVAGTGTAVEAVIQQQGEGGLPEQSMSVEQVATATAAPTTKPTEAPTEAPGETSSESTTEGETPTEAPTEAPAVSVDTGGASSSSGETINVTMNGTAQTMDLVECLAMVAQNELGSKAPAEAYKAQCVAAHCWIISQGGYPSVLGQTPGATARAAAEEVAHVLITYNGQVCFTPYFASASTGTASSAEVWGGERAWLQAVDSPYDESLSSNWNTNGNTSGSARFSRQTLQDRILAEMDVDLSGIDPNEWFTIVSANQYGWVSKMRVGPTETCSGRWFRENLLARQSVDGRSLRSQCFTFEYNADLDCFIFDVYGYGHGCGMSQWGAIGYAQNGWSYESILTHYFTGTTLTTY